MDYFLFTQFLSTLGLMTFATGITHQVNSDEDTSFYYNPRPGTPAVQKSHSISEKVTQIRPVQDNGSQTQRQRSSEKLEKKQALDLELDSTIPWKRYATGGYGYNNGGYGSSTGGYGYNTGGGFGYNSGGNSGWSGGSTNPGFGYSSGGIVCTVCTSYDSANAQRCCAFGYRQCCNVRVHDHHHHAGAGYGYVSPPSGGGYGYGSGSGSYEKPGTCGTFGYTTGRYVNQNAGYYATRRKDSDSSQIERVKRDAPVNDYQSYGVPLSGGGGYHYSSGGSFPSTSSFGSSGYYGGYLPPSSGYNSGYCRQDYDCSGIKKCCSGYCSNPVATIG